MSTREIVEAALEASTPQAANRLNALIASDIGGEYRRPIGDKFQNHGLIGSAGSFDLKLIEQVTNMQDAVVEKLALQKWGAPEDVPYNSPHSAAQDLLGHLDPTEASKMAHVTFRESTTDQMHLASKTKKLTAVFRDAGCGMTADQVPRTILDLGGSNKDSALYLQGAFGIGGTMTYRNADSVVLVTRRDPSLLNEDERDEIVVAVVQWQNDIKGKTAYYLVDHPWERSGDPGNPWSCDAQDYPTFSPGTHLALISYGVEGLHRQREGDDRSFDTVANTRLYRPVFPIRWVNETSRANRATTIRGLENRLERTDHNFPSWDESLPISLGGETYILPVSYTVFGKPRDAGGADKFVAKNHAVLFTSNGQVHNHWSPEELRNRTGLSKIYNRVLVVVETDELPIKLRSGLFTPDRNDVVATADSRVLEDSVAAVIKGSETLQDENNALLREALQGSSDVPSIEIAKRISRAISVSGFSSSGGVGSSGVRGTLGGRSGGGGGKRQEIPLLPDPSFLSGPDTIRAVIGETTSMTLTINAEDRFFDGRGEILAATDHPEVRANHEVTVGKAHSGRARVLIAVPDFVSPGSFLLTTVVESWMSAGGGLGKRLEHTVKIELVERIEGAGRGEGAKASSGGSGQSGPSTGTHVALQWSNPSRQESWSKTSVGEVIAIPASTLASTAREYAELATLGEVEIPTILLNEEFPPLKRYLETRNRKLTDLTRPRETYAVGVGVALLLLKKELDLRRTKESDTPDDAFVQEAQRSAAQSVLAVMPAFDELAKEAGLD